jgi:hypothetical protein
MTDKWRDVPPPPRGQVPPRFRVTIEPIDQDESPYRATPRVIEGTAAIISVIDADWMTPEDFADTPGGEIRTNTWAHGMGFLRELALGNMLGKEMIHAYADGGRQAVAELVQRVVDIAMYDGKLRDQIEEELQEEEPPENVLVIPPHTDPTVRH